MGKTALFDRQAQNGLVTVGGPNYTTGDVWFVDSGATLASDAVTHGSSPDAPFATLDYAIGQCTTEKGDVIYVMPGHSETGSTALQELFDLDKASTSVIGLGEGDLRPTFNLEEATVTCVMGAAGCRISNLVFIGGVDELVAVLEVEAAATGCRIDHCYFKDTATDEDMLTTIVIAADADRLEIDNNQFIGIAGGEATECMVFAGGSDGTIIHHNIFNGDWKTLGTIAAAGAASANLVIHNNFITNVDTGAGLVYTGHGSSTGLIAHNFCGGSKANTHPLATVTLMHCAENYGNDVAASSGLLTPVVDTW